MISATKLFTTLILACVAFSATAFAPTNKVNSLSTVITPAARVTTTALSERKWNFNEGYSPWGLKINAETWNGRVAQVREINILSCPLGLSISFSIQELTCTVLVYNCNNVATVDSLKRWLLSGYFCKN
jgi:hypothetical protein